MKTLKQLLKNYTLTAMFLLGVSLNAQAQNLPSSSLEYTDGPSAKITLEELKGIKKYATNANADISRLLITIGHLDDSVEIKQKLMGSIEALIKDSTDQRSVLLLTHSLQAGMTIVKLIEKNTVKAGIDQTPQGTVDQEIRILKQSLIFAQFYYESDFNFINGVLAKNEAKINPKFVEFGVKLSKFLMRMSDGVLNVRSSYGIARWSLGVLANYIKNDKEVGIIYASTLTNLVKELSTRELYDNSPVYPDLVNGETAPSDIDCLLKIQSLKLLAEQSFAEIAAVDKGYQDKIDQKLAQEKAAQDAIIAKQQADEKEARRLAHLNDPRNIESSENFLKVWNFTYQGNNYGKIAVYNSGGVLLADLLEWNFNGASYTRLPVTVEKISLGSQYCFKLGDTPIVLTPVDAGGNYRYQGGSSSVGSLAPINIDAIPITKEVSNKLWQFVYQQNNYGKIAVYTENDKVYADLLEWNFNSGSYTRLPVKVVPVSLGNSFEFALNGTAINLVPTLDRNQYYYYAGSSVGVATEIKK